METILQHQDESNNESKSVVSASAGNSGTFKKKNRRI